MRTLGICSTGCHWEEDIIILKRPKRRLERLGGWRHLLSRVGQPEIWVQSLEPGWWKERSNFCKLSTALYMHPTH